jgi:peptide/nickel transport system permease protein
MLSYAFKRILLMVPVLLAISFIVFVLVELPPGDYCSNQYRDPGTSPPPGCRDR